MAEPEGRPRRVLAIGGGVALLYGVPAGVGISAAQTLPWTMACILPCYVAGLSLSWHSPHHPVARRLLAAGSFAAIGMAVRLSMGKPPATGWHADTPRAWALLGVARTFDVLAAITLCRLVALLPDGLVRRGYERVVLRALWLLVPYPVLLMALPLSDKTRPWLLVVPESWAPGLGAGLLLIRSLLDARERRAGHAPRTDRLWVIALIAFVVFAGRGSARLFRLWLAGQGLNYFIGSALGALPYITISAGLVYAAFRHRLPGMDFAIRRSLVYGVLWTIIGAWYLGMTTALGLTAGQYLPIGLAVFVAVSATMLFQPVHRQLNRLAARRVFGARPTSFELLVQCGTTLEHAYDLTRLGPQLAVTLREGLDLRWVRVRLGPAGPGRAPFGSGSAGAESGQSPWGEVRLRYGEEVLGSIEYGPKEEGRFTPEDQDVIETLARQAALAVHNALLTAELSTRVDEVQRQACELNASRTRIVQAQDTERRRIERQLHDGIQQELVALVAKLALARNQLCRNGDTVHTTLTELQDDACRVIDELREVAHGIHPPVLTDQGLAAAVLSKARRLPLPVVVEVDPSVSSARFAPEIEEAAFFLVSEALTNVLKHARADGVTIRIGRADGSLLLDVSDDGVGLPAASRLGSGLTGMRDRIEAVGGRLSIAGRPGGGTTLRAQLTERSRETAHA
ncbi:GAF domain-containing sensor histidine kinase [Streptomyces sp. TLI_146]|uniref:sensor histidine kinase n=1 Tax=Streptomyces sp. TLI_146 TaxID=1938858 RepID=UPI000CC48A8E|nr:GAF domain-containing sensor histidine kinase [Streptomyces sp. TLI_146]PKV83925.1 histidine kinase/DNA gyrase B/HSP90-like ATPase [Streptomyces sp. TLI_146]